MELKIFSGRSNEPLAREVVKHISGISNCPQNIGIGKFLLDLRKNRLGEVIIKDFPDGEVYVRYGESVRGDDAFLIQSTNQPDKNLEELRQMVQAARQAQAESVTVVFPYFGYARQDRRDRPRAAVSAVGILRDLVGRGANRFVFLDPHSNALEAALSWEPVPFDRLWARIAIVPFLKQNASLFPYTPDNLVLASPDLGAISLANIYAESFEEYAGQIPVVAVAKRRRPGESETEVLFVVGENEIKKLPDVDVLVVDDMIDGGSTLLKAVKEFKELGAGRIYAVMTHGVFSGESLAKIAASPVEKIFITNSIRHQGNAHVNQSGLALCEHKLVYISIASLLAEAIIRIHTNQSVSEMFE